MNRRQIESQLRSKAEQDPAFRQVLVTDPRAAVEKALGLSVPAGIQLSVMEETSDRLCLVLPAPKGELSDLELESVAGGKDDNSGSSSGMQLGRGGIVIAVPPVSLRHEE